jgi:outer membrane protein assembly factor BamB
MRIFMRNLLTFLALFIPATLVPAAENWPQFRGPHGDGHADATDLPIHWSESENIVWKTPIPYKGWSSPVIWGNQIWLTTARADGTQMFGVCVDRDTGKVVHQLKIFDIEKPEFCIAFNSYASPTPAIEEGRVYLHFGTYGTVCVGTATGKILWSQRDLHCNHFRGPGSSPILYRDWLFVNFDGYDLQYIVALDKHTGKVAWKRDRDIGALVDNGDMKKAYGTPSLVEVNGQPQLISSGGMSTLALDPATGQVIWRVNHGGMNSAVPPLAGRGLVFLSSADGGFGLCAVREGGKGDITESHVEWKYNKSTPSRCGPLLIGDLLYFIHEKGVVTCLDAKTGTKVWQARLGGEFSASPLYADGHIYFASQDGATHVVEPGRAFKVLAVNKLDDGCMASPAVAGKALFLRTKTHLYRIERNHASGK